MRLSQRESRRDGIRRGTKVGRIEGWVHRCTNNNLGENNSFEGITGNLE